MNTLIDKILDNFADPNDDSLQYDPPELLSRAKSELLKAIMECKPEKLDSTNSEYVRGYIDSTNQWENNIKALFGENKEG